MNNTNTQTDSKPMRHATLYTVLDKVERILFLVDTALTGTVLDKDENGKEITATPETIYQFVFDVSNDAINDLKAISAEIEELANLHEYQYQHFKLDPPSVADNQSKENKDG